MNKKRVRFDKATILLVSKLTDYTECHVLWWSKKDATESKITAFDEINKLRKKHKEMTLKDAVKLLYQPNNISFNEANFHII